MRSGYAVVWARLSWACNCLRSSKAFNWLGLSVHSLIKLHYGDPKVHYEVWIRRRLGTIELGLHFEGVAEENLRYLDRLTTEYSSVIKSLGPDVEPERWAGTWTRVHRALPFSTLDEDILMVASGYLTQMVRVLEPAVREISETL